MKKQFKTWDEHLGKRLRNMQGEPAFDAWDKIEASLDKKPRRSWLWMAAAIVLIAAPTGLYLWQIPTTGQAGSTASHEVAANGKEHSQALDTSGKDTNKEKTEQTYPDLGDHKDHSTKRIAGILENENEPEKAITESVLEPEQHSQSLAMTHEQPEHARLGTEEFKESSGQVNIPSKSAHKDASLITKATIQHTNKIEPLAELVLLTSREPVFNTPAYTIGLPQLKKTKTLQPLEIAQVESANVKPRDKKKQMLSSVWVAASPTWAYRRVEPNQSDDVVITSLDTQPAFASARMGGQLAAGFSYPISKKLEWKTGAHYWYQQQNWSYSYHNGEPESYKTSFDKSNGLRVEALYDEQTQVIDVDLHNLGISTGLSYRLPTRFAPSELDTKVLAQYNSTQKFSSYISLAYVVKASLDGHVTFNAGPSLQLQLNNNENMSQHFQERPLSLGLQMGVSF